jgi:hypothetical protein
MSDPLVNKIKELQQFSTFSTNQSLISLLTQSLQSNDQEIQSKFPLLFSKLTRLHFQLDGFRVNSEHNRATAHKINPLFSNHTNFKTGQ